MTEARTDRAQYVFKVSEAADGTPWISTEPLRAEDIPLLEHAFIGFDLPRGTTLEEAQQIARYLNDNLESISVTLFDRHPMFSVKPSGR